MLSIAVCCDCVTSCPICSILPTFPVSLKLPPSRKSLENRHVFWEPGGRVRGSGRDPRAASLGWWLRGGPQEAEGPCAKLQALPESAAQRSGPQSVDTITSSFRFSCQGRSRRLNGSGEGTECLELGEASTWRPLPTCSQVPGALNVWVDSPLWAPPHVGFRHFPVSAWSAWGPLRGAEGIHVPLSPPRVRRAAAPTSPHPRRPSSQAAGPLEAPPR